MTVHQPRWLTLRRVTLAGYLLLASALGGCAPAPNDVPSEKGEPLFTLGGLTKALGNVTYSPDGELLAAAERHGKIVKVWKASDCTEVLTLEAEHVSDVAFSPDSKHLALASRKDQIRDARTGETIRSLEMTEPAVPVSSVAWSSNGRWIGFIGGRPRRYKPKVRPEDEQRNDAYMVTYDLLQLFDATAGKQVLEQEQPRYSRLYAIAFSTDGNRLAWRETGSPGTIRLWEVPSGKEVLQVRAGVSLSGRPVFSPDGALLACATELNGWGGEPPDTKSEPKKPGDPWWSKIQVWNATTGKELCLLPGHRKTILCVAFSADSNYIASGAEDGAVQIWNVTTQRLVATLAGHKEAVCSVAFSPDGKRLASGAGRYYDTPGEVKVWDVTPYVKLWEK